MLWNRSSAKALPLPESSALAEFDVALETLADLLRTFGEGGFDTESLTAVQLAQATRDWAGHLLLRIPPPTQPEGSAVAERDWNGVRHFFHNQRQSEQQYVIKAIDDLRHVIWAFIQSLGHAAIEDGALEARTQSQIQRLRATLEKSSVEEIKKETLGVVNELNGLITLRKQQQESRNAELRTQLDSLGSRLQEAERDRGTDPLTQLANRRTFDGELARAATVFHAVGQTSSLLAIDIDYFKQVNDEHGHPVGDRVLQAFAETMVLSFPRKIDTVARIGGEEFAVILRDTGVESARRLGLRFLDKVRTQSIPVPKGSLTLTASIGVAVPLPGEVPAGWLERADAALYAAKRAGRDRLVIDRGA